ncbi:hypothetical protein [Salipiger sp.]|uniref:hypothetical protein n=1 Tax=Salipiger sp. TaxID=2078585 RepID=UPI003A9710FF
MTTNTEEVLRYLEHPAKWSALKVRRGVYWTMTFLDGFRVRKVVECAAALSLQQIIDEISAIWDAYLARRKAEGRKPRNVEAWEPSMGTDAFRDGWVRP